MDVNTGAVVMAGGGALGVLVWVLAKLGKVLITIAEALAAAAAVFLALWLAIKAVLWALRQTLTHWRTSLTVVGALAWWHWWGWVSLATTGAVVAGTLTGWRLLDLVSFDAWAPHYAGVMLALMEVGSGSTHSSLISSDVDSSARHPSRGRARGR